MNTTKNNIDIILMTAHIYFWFAKITLGVEQSAYVVCDEPHFW